MTKTEKKDMKPNKSRACSVISQIFGPKFGHNISAVLTLRITGDPRADFEIIENQFGKSKK